MRDRFSLGDYTGALGVAEKILEEDPSHEDARHYAGECRSVLEQMYTARIGPLDRIPLVAVPREQLRWLSIDHRAGFILSHIDGVSTLEMTPRRERHAPPRYLAHSLRAGRTARDQVPLSKRFRKAQGRKCKGGEFRGMRVAQRDSRRYTVIP